MKVFFLSLILFIQGDVQPLFQAVVNSAKTSNKPILLVFSGSDWCSNCIKLKTNVFDQEEFKSLQTETFEMYIADFPRTKTTVEDQRTSENERLAEQFNPQGKFPLVLFLDADLNVLKKTSGKLNTVDEFKAWLSL
jgi:thioredoxin-related protein